MQQSRTEIFTTWGAGGVKRWHDYDMRTLKRYVKALQRIETYSTCSTWVLSTALAGLLFYAVLNDNFENVIFYDGTELICTMERGERFVALDNYGKRVHAALGLQRNKN